jgi:hypothetical protein
MFLEKKNLGEYNSFIKEHKGKRLLWMSVYRWEDNIKCYVGGLGCKCVRIVPEAHAYERGNELSGWIKYREFSDQPIDYQLLMKDSAS